MKFSRRRLGSAVRRLGKSYKDYDKGLQKSLIRKVREEYLKKKEIFEGIIPFGMPGEAPPREKPEEEKKEEPEEPSDDLEEKVGGIDLSVVGLTEESAEEEVPEERPDVRYPLTPPHPKDGDKVYAWCNIRWDQAANGLIYHVKEPSVTPDDEREIERLHRIMEEKIDIDFNKIKQGESEEYVKAKIKEIIKEFSLKVSPEKQSIYEYYIVRDFMGLGKLQPIMNDEAIEDVSCDGVGVPVFIFHRNPKLSSLKTNVTFTTDKELDDFVARMAQRCGRTVSIADPLFQGALPDGSRVQATLGRDVARRGSNFTIRKFTKDPITPVLLLNYGSVDAKMLAFMWMAIENSASVLVSGPTASGKTSLLNALSLFIKPSLKIVSIEDTPELALPHAHWVPEVARAGFGMGIEGKTHGEVSMFDLLKGSLRQRPDYIIVGEVRGAEASVLFQEMATGHPGLSTIHADSLPKVIDRLTTQPINLPESLLETLDLIVFAKRLKYQDKFVRRTTEVREIVRYDYKTKRIKTNKLFEWNASNDTFEAKNQSFFLGKLIKNTGMTEEKIRDEIARRIKVLNWMQKRYITDYVQVGKVLDAYYTKPSELMALIEGEEEK